MIGRLRGIILEKQPPHLLIDVHDIAYEIQAPLSSFYRLPEVGQSVVLFTHLVVREDAHILFGFVQQQERTLFRDLIKVNNVGPKLALTVLSGMEPDAFVRCVLEQDTTSLSRLPGVGKKTAERLVVEMRDRLSDWQPDNSIVKIMPTLPIGDVLTRDAISALVALGYKPQEARQAVMRVPQPHTSSEELIRHALQTTMK